MRSTTRRQGRAAGAFSATQEFLPESLEARQLFDVAGPPTVFQTGSGNAIADLNGSPSDAIAVEFNGDGKQDMIVAQEKQVFFLRGRGGGRFDAPVQVQRLNAKAGLVSVGDFNADGRPDFVSVQPGRTGGFMRLFLNTGDGFELVSYALTGTAVESVVNGNLDFAAGNEIVVQGRSSTINQETGLPNYELRLFRINLAVPALAGGTPGAQLVDSGVYVTNSRMGVPAIANVVNNDTFIVVGREDPSAAGQGLVDFVNLVNDTGTPRLNLRGSIGGFAGVPTGVAIGDVNDDAKVDLAVSTLQYPSGGTSGASTGTFTGRTYLFTRKGFVFDVQFNDPAVIDQRTIAGASGMNRTWDPEYRVSGPFNINNDGRPDFGLSVVQDFNTGAGRAAKREASFVQLLQNADGSFTPSTVASMVTTGNRADVPYDRVVTFLPNDVRGVGRPDLVFIQQSSFNATPLFRALYNVKA